MGIEMRQQMKKLLLMIGIIGMTLSLSAEKIIVLPGILQPRRIASDNRQLYILQESGTVSIYSIDNVKPLKTFSKKGEGPGELRFLPVLTVLPESIILSNTYKIIYYSKKGELLKERRIPWESVCIPLGNNYVFYFYNFDQKKKILTTTVNLYDKNFKKIKEIYRSKKESSYIVRGSHKVRGKMKIIDNYFSVQNFDNTLFIADGSKGLFIDVFNSEGARLNSIKKDYKIIPIDSKDREKLIHDYLTENPSDRKIWKELMKQNDLIFPDYFPAIKSAQVADKKIYIETYKEKENKTEWIILDLKGNIIKKVFLPRAEIGIVERLCAFSNNKYYYLEDNEETEDWELHILDI
jgi:hypothetical protein